MVTTDAIVPIVIPTISIALNEFPFPDGGAEGVTLWGTTEELEFGDCGMGVCGSSVGGDSCGFDDDADGVEDEVTVGDTVSSQETPVKQVSVPSHSLSMPLGHDFSHFSASA